MCWPIVKARVQRFWTDLIPLVAVAVVVAGCSGPDLPQPEPSGPVPLSTLGPGDVFEVRVYGEEDLTGEYRVASDGSINFPLIGLSILVEVVVIFLCLRLAGMILRFEDVFTGSYEGNFLALIKNRLLKRKEKTPPEGERL